MGGYLNSRSSYSLFCEDYASAYYIDKTDILAELVPIVELKENLSEQSDISCGKGQKYVAITRPRRFGKTVMANMIASYFGKGVDSSKDFATDQDKASFTKFLSYLLKDNAYVEMAYMTGILPIAKYSSGSELNMFFEYSMATRVKYSGCFGFTDEEVDILYQRYQNMVSSPAVTREGLELWYDGYQTAGGQKLYNPRSVVGALSDNQLGSYWTSSGPYDEIFYYIGANTDAVKDDIAAMVADNPVPARVQEYAATSMELKTRDEIFSAMVVYGFLNYKDGYVSIPNKELMDKFAEVVQREPSLRNVYKLTKESGRMLAATKAGDTKTMAELIEYAHNTHSPLQTYSNEAELASIIRWVYPESSGFLPHRAGG